MLQAADSARLQLLRQQLHSETFYMGGEIVEAFLEGPGNALFSEIETLGSVESDPIEGIDEELRRLIEEDE